MPRGVRNQPIQIPGEKQADVLDPEDALDPEDVRTLTDLETLQAQLAAMTAENAKLRAGQAGVGRVEMEGNSQYAHTHSSQVDLKSIKAPVLCADGWLVP